MNTEQHLHQLLRVGFAYQQEKWITAKNENVCPMCSELESLGWIPMGLLPPYRQAHSILGEGRWNAPDSSCQCKKGYKRAKGNLPAWADGILTWDDTTKQYLVMSTKQTFSDLCKERIKTILATHKQCTCK